MVVELSIGHDFKINPHLRVSRKSASFSVQTNDPELDFALLGIGISATPEAFDEVLTFLLSYDAQVGQDN